MKLRGLLPVVGVNKVIWLLASGLLLVLLSFYLGYAGFPYILTNKIKSSVALNNGTPGMETWENLPAPMEFRIYILNVTNPVEVTQGGQPILEEIGPYIYDEHLTHINITPAESDTLIYRSKKTYNFNKAKSGCHRESDVITSLNVPLLGMAYMIEEKFPMGMSLLNAAVPFLFGNITTPFMTTTVGQLLFDGVRINCSHPTGPAMPICRGLRSSLPPPIRPIQGTEDFGFSIFQMINGTPSGFFKIYRGNENIYDLGKIVEYDNLTYLSLWEKNSTCSQLKGTDTSILSPIYNSEDDLYLYLAEVCLSLKASFAGEFEINGIHVYKYESASSNFAAYDEVEENICRCNKKSSNKKPVCLKKGAIDATKCQGAEVIFTPPHFLNSDKEYQSFAVGLVPNKSKHETEVFVEPRTGVPLASFKRIQMNLFTKRMEDVGVLVNISEGLFPLIWVEEAISDEMKSVYMPALQEMMSGIKIMNSITWLLLGIGLFCLAISLILYLKFKKISCFKDNQVVSNISLVGPGNPSTKYGDNSDNKRTVFSIPTAYSGSESNSIQPFSTTTTTTTTMYADRNQENQKKSDNGLPR